jgi:hypothetical protein
MPKIKWIKLPVEFLGIWYSPEFGGFNIYLRDRFNPAFPPDRLNEWFKRNDPRFVRKDHEGAEPIWLTREGFEHVYGKVEAILVNEETWNSARFTTPTNEDLLFFTPEYVVTMTEYDGAEAFLSLPRDWRRLLEVKG